MPGTIHCQDAEQKYALFFLGFRAKRGNAPVSTGRLFVLNDLL